MIVNKNSVFQGLSMMTINDVQEEVKHMSKESDMVYVLEQHEFILTYRNLYE